MARQVSNQAVLAICTSRSASSGVWPKAEHDFKSGSWHDGQCAGFDGRKDRYNIRNERASIGEPVAASFECDNGDSIA